MRIDTRRRFWAYNENDDSCMSSEQDYLSRAHLPVYLRSLLASVVVHARQVDTETGWLLKQTVRKDFIRGVVGRVELTGTAVEE